jgi:hypothetical protein
MKPHDRLTVFRNRVRARDLRLFRGRIQAYFDQFEYDAEGLPVDWEGSRAARAEINRMLPRVMQIVEAADLGASSGGSARHPAGRAGEILQGIFRPGHAQEGCQEILDVIDMAIGVYDASQYSALLRTFNPFYYVLTALGFLAGLPRRALVAIGLVRPHASRIRPEDLTRLQAALSRLAGTEELIETRFAEMRELQSRLFQEHGDLVTDLAERMDFMERVLAQQSPPERLKLSEKKAITPR